MCKFDMVIWKHKKVDKSRDLWTKGDVRFGDFVIVDKTLGAVNRYTKDKYQVSARRKINKQTVSGHHRFYTNKTSALKFAKAYMLKY